MARTVDEHVDAPQRSLTRSTRRVRSSIDWLEPVTPIPPSAPASASPLPEDEMMPM